MGSNNEKNTVTISTAEYSDLCVCKAYLRLILDSYNEYKTWENSNVIKAIMSNVKTVVSPSGSCGEEEENA